MESTQVEVQILKKLPDIGIYEFNNIPRDIAKLYPLKYSKRNLRRIKHMAYFFRKRKYTKSFPYEEIM